MEKIINTIKYLATCFENETKEEYYNGELANKLYLLESNICSKFPKTAEKLSTVCQSSIDGDRKQIAYSLRSIANEMQKDFYIKSLLSWFPFLDKKPITKGYSYVWQMVKGRKSKKRFNTKATW